MRSQKGQALIELILFGVAAAFAIKIMFLLTAKIWIENLSQVYLQEYIFCQQSAFAHLGYSNCQNQFRRKFENAIPFAIVQRLRHSKRSRNHTATVRLGLPLGRTVVITKTLVLE